MEEFTTIRLSKNTKRKLDEIGRKFETHDDILKKIIKSFESKEAKHGKTR